MARRRRPLCTLRQHPLGNLLHDATIHGAGMGARIKLRECATFYLTRRLRVIYGRCMITREDRLRWSDVRARLSQGERVPDADYHFFIAKKDAIRAINSCGLARSCRHLRRIGNKSNPVFDAMAREAMA